MSAGQLADASDAKVVLTNGHPVRWDAPARSLVDRR
jgi:hypothetical protein